MSGPKSPPVHTRWMLHSDKPEVVAMELDCFGVYAWDEDDFTKSLRQPNTIGMVAEVGGDIAGYMLYELRKNRLRVLNFAVSPGFRRIGVATCMVDKLKSKLAANGRHRLMIEVSEENLGGQLFFKAKGFTATNILKGFYDNSDQDAYLFQFDYISAEDETLRRSELRRQAQH